MFKSGGRERHHMRILLVDPHFVDMEGTLVSEVAGVFPSLGILSLAAVLRKEHEVAVLDCQFYTTKSAEEEIRKFSPGLVAISSTTPWIGPALSMGRVAKEGGSVVVLGGPHPTARPEECLLRGVVDAAVIGEAEETMPELCRRVEAKRGFAGVKGLAFREGKRIRRTPPRPPLTDLDVLPMHAWDLVPVRKYFSSSVSRKRQESIALMASRGCPWRCSFCSKGPFGSLYRWRHPALVIEEMRYLNEKYGKRDFMFVDDVFTFPEERIRAFCKGLMETGLDIGWCCQTRADLVRRDLLSLMRKAGCYQIGLGAESGNDEMLARIHKQLKVSTIVDAAKMIREAGMESKASFIIGFPGETEEQVRDTLDLTASLPVDYPFIQFFNPLPGSEIYEEAMRSGHLRGNELSRGIGRLRGMDYVPDSLSADFLLSMYNRGHRRIYCNPRWMIRYLVNLRSPDDLMKGVAGMLEVLRTRRRDFSP